MKKLTLGSHGFSLVINHGHGHLGLVQRLEEFLAPFFGAALFKSEDLALFLHSPEEFPAEAKKFCTVPTPIRISSSPDFNLSAMSSEIEGGSVLWDFRNQVGYVIDKSRSIIHLYGGDNSFYHLIEMIRYYGLRVEELRGAVILHSSGVVSNDTGEAIAIAGVKGAGKTSTMINLVSTGRWSFLSGDKLLVRARDGEVTVSGWPDYPHVGLGSLRHQPKLCRQLEGQLDFAATTPNTDKVLIPPDTFRKFFPIASAPDYKLGKLIVPNVKGSDEFQIESLSMLEKKAIPRESLIEEASKFLAATWHGLRPRLLDSCEQSHRAIWDKIYALPWERWVGPVPEHGDCAAGRSGPLHSVGSTNCSIR